MGELFKLAFVGKFSFGRPPVDVVRKLFVSLRIKGDSQVFLLDNRHISIILKMRNIILGYGLGRLVTLIVGVYMLLSGPLSFIV